ncbi:MAG: Ni,Fe-hydrogenase III large subunit [Clostridiaceae bacterium]|nr:Ni,Fe-hydrogenase III large subunit [Clostridiaceae bacterium]
MIRNLSDKRSASLLSKLFGFKSMGFELLLIEAYGDNNKITVNYLLEKEGQFESVDITVSENTAIPSVTLVYPRGERMEADIEQRFPVLFNRKSVEVIDEEGYSLIDWGPFHPLLTEPVLFHLLMKDEVIKKVSFETGYNYREVEKLCTGRKVWDIPDILERVSSANGISLSLAFASAVEDINGFYIPQKAQWVRLVINEMSCVNANLHGLYNTARCLGLYSDSVRISRLVNLYREAAGLICSHPLLFGIIGIGGINKDIPKDTFYAANAVLQEIESELANIRKRWESTAAIAKRLRTTGFIDSETAMTASGRLARAAGNAVDSKKYSKLPYDELPYTVPVREDSNCYARTMLKFDDLTQSLRLIDMGIENMPKGEVKLEAKMKKSGEALAREPGAEGEVIVRVKLEKDTVDYIFFRNDTTVNISFLPSCLNGAELTDLPLIVSSLDLDLSGMEK